MGGRKRERNITVWLLFKHPPTRGVGWGGDQAHNPGLCPDWESSRRPFGSQAGTQSSEPHQPGPINPFYNLVSLWYLGPQRKFRNSSISTILPSISAIYLLIYLILYVALWS